MEGGSKVYIYDDEHAWVGATLISIDASKGEAEVEVQADGVLGLPGGELRKIDLTRPELKALQQQEQEDTNGGGAKNGDGIAAAARLPLQNLDLPEQGVEDMCSLSSLHEPAILFNLRARFLAKQPYTYTGDVAISINPYEWINGLYSDELKETYLLSAGAPLSELPPHIYAISALAYRGITGGGQTGFVDEEEDGRGNQSIVISGESGAGKTEGVKQLVAHLASIAGKRGGEKKEEEEGDEDGGGSTVEKILESNPLLESYGNAQTVRNDNSSRFGKYLELHFAAAGNKANGGKQPLLVGSKCITYLLEKSRVVHHAKGERNYHIFYQLLAAPETDKAAVGLAGKTVADFHYMRCDHGGSQNTVIEGKSDAERFHATVHALSLVGVDKEMQQQLWSVLAGILYLGEVEFVGEEGASGDEEARIKNPEALQQAAGLLLATLGEKTDAADGSNKEGTAALGKALCSRTVKTRHESYAVPMTPSQAIDARDALAKEVYSRMFGWLVQQINASTLPESTMTTAAGAGRKQPPRSKTKTIGLLDIFGFESFAVNRFEQLCINLANEKIQQKFTADVFKTVQQEYEEEGIEWRFIEFRDNAPVLELIEGRMGLITVLNEECMLAKGGDSSFTSKLTALHTDHPHLQKDRLNPLDFTVTHYAGPVKYTASGFVARNRDTLLEDLGASLSNSKKSLVQALFPSSSSSQHSNASPLTSPTGNSSTPTESNNNHMQRKKGGGTIVAETVTTKFKRQLTDLMETISSTQVRYIRCIKPNPSKSPHLLEPRMVLEQLRCAGVIEAIRISRSAYPNRLPHHDFLQRFRLLAPSVATRGGDEEEQTRALLTHLLPLSPPQKVSQKEAEAAEETKPLWEMGRTRVYFTKGVLEQLEEQRLAMLNSKATILQRYVRGSHQAKIYGQLRTQVITAQAMVRAWRQRTAYQREKRRIVNLQALWRRKRDVKLVHAKRLQARSTTIQTAVRRHLHRTRYLKVRGGTVRMQAVVRQRQARKAYLVALAEAKEQAKLENQLEALKRRLEEESEARKVAEQKLQEAAVAGGTPPKQQQQQQQQQQQDLGSSLDGSVGGQQQGQNVSGNNGGNLSEEQGQMLEYLRRKVLKYRDQCLVFKRETEGYKKMLEALRAENQRVKDAHAAAGLSFTALNQHSSNLQRINKRLMREHQQAVEEAQRLEATSLREIGRLREDFVRHNDKMQAQAKRLKEELAGKVELYNLEVQMRVKQDRTMQTMIALVQKRAGETDPELVEELVEMHHTCHMGVYEDVASRFSFLGGTSGAAPGAAGVDDGSVKSRASKLLGALGNFVNENF